MAVRCSAFSPLLSKQASALSADCFPSLVTAAGAPLCLHDTSRERVRTVRYFYPHRSRRELTYARNSLMPSCQAWGVKVSRCTTRLSAQPGRCPQKSEGERQQKTFISTHDTNTKGMFVCDILFHVASLVHVYAAALRTPRSH